MSSPKYIDKSNEYNFLKPWLNEGLLLSKGKNETENLVLDCLHLLMHAYYWFLFFLFRSGKKWFERRKIITPAFHFKILEEYVEIFDRLGNVFVNKTLAKFDVKDEVEIYPLAILYALDVMCGECLQMESEINSRTQRYRTNCVRRTVRVWCVFVMRAAG